MAEMEPQDKPDISSLPPMCSDLSALHNLAKVLVYWERESWVNSINYTIKDIYGDVLYTTVEPTATIWNWFQGATRRLTLELMDNQKMRHVLSIEHPKSTFAKSQLQIMNSDNELVNLIKVDRSSTFSSAATITVREPNGDVIFVVEWKELVGVLELNSILTETWTVKHGIREICRIKRFIYSLSKKMNPPIVNGPRFEVNFPSDMFTRLKVSLIAVTILINLTLLRERSDAELYPTDREKMEYITMFH